MVHGDQPIIEGTCFESLFCTDTPNHIRGILRSRNFLAGPIMLGARSLLLSTNLMRLALRGRGYDVT